MNDKRVLLRDRFGNSMYPDCSGIIKGDFNIIEEYAKLAGRVLLLELKVKELEDIDGDITN